MNELNAIIYAVVAGLGAIVTAGSLPSTPIEWCGLALVVITTGWGKYTNSDEFVQLKTGRDLKMGRRFDDPR